VNVWWAWTDTAGSISFATHIGGFAAGTAAVVVAGARGTVEEWRFA
jgi:membrane associated rhomboid family serine protease